MIIGDRSDPLYRAFCEGEAAYKQRIPLSKNPYYSEQKRLRDEWMRGHTSAREKQE